MFQSLDYIHIIALWVLFVVLVTVYIICRIWTKETLLEENENIIGGYIEKKKAAIAKGNVRMRLSSYFLLLLGCPIVIGFSSYLLLHNAVFSLLFSVAGFMVPEGILMFLRQREARIFEEKYGRSLEQLASALRAGLSIMQAVKEVSENRFVYEPVRNRYKQLYANLTMGISIKDAFQIFADSTDSQDAQDVALVIDIQNEIGGREAEVIQTIAKDIHDRILLRKEVRSIFAGTSYIVWVMDFLPFGLMAFLCFTNDTFRQYYFHGYGILLLAGIVAICLIGSLFNHRKIRKVVKSA